MIWVQKYTSDLRVTSEPSRPLTSAGTGFHFAPRVGGKASEAAFSSNAATIWNKFPINCRFARSLSAVTSTLERVLFAATFGYLHRNVFFVLFCFVF